MEVIQNNTANYIRFPHNDIDVSDSKTAEFKQLGRDTVVSLPISIDDLDCYSVLYKIELTENQLPNATYIVKFYDSFNDVLFTTTLIVSGNTDETRAYIVLDD